MTALHLLRHAHAGDSMTWDGPDEIRPLSDKGQRQAERLGAFLAGIGFSTDAMITSPKIRAAQTAEIVARVLGVPVIVDERLGGGLGLSTVEVILDDAGGPLRPVLVGHDPDFTDLVRILTGSSGVTMRKGAMCRIDVEPPIASGHGDLAWLVPPELLKPAR